MCLDAFCLSGVVLTWFFQVVYLPVISKVWKTFSSTMDTLSLHSDSAAVIAFRHFTHSSPVSFIQNRCAFPGNHHMTHKCGNDYGFHITIQSMAPLRLSPPVPTVWKCLFPFWCDSIVLEPLLRLSPIFINLYLNSRNESYLGCLSCPASYT